MHESRAKCHAIVLGHWRRNAATFVFFLWIYNRDEVNHG